MSSPKLWELGQLGGDVCPAQGHPMKNADLGQRCLASKKGCCPPATVNTGWLVFLSCRMTILQLPGYPASSVCLGLRDLGTGLLGKIVGEDYFKVNDLFIN